MSLVPSKKNAHQQVILEGILRDRLPSLDIHEIMSPQGLKRAFVRPFVKCRRRPVIFHDPEGAILILSPGAGEKLTALADPLRRSFMANLVSCKTALVILAQCRTWPVPLKKIFKPYPIPAMISSLHENLLESRIKAILREKIKKCITVHGVALEFQGRGILIRGVSGIGKTTSLLQAMPEGGIWIADDRVVIKKQPSGKLLVSGQGRIKNYFHTREMGIMSVDRMVQASQIKANTELRYVIDVIRSDADPGACSLHETEIMESRLPLLQVHVSGTGYFDKNLLTEAIQKLTRSDH
ncbi:MAG: hypothetical protein K4571_14180 [Deltaproteobacteria bacterium]